MTTAASPRRIRPSTWARCVALLLLAGCTETVPLSLARLEDPTRALDAEAAAGAPGWQELPATSSPVVSVGTTRAATWLRLRARLAAPARDARRILYLGPSGALRVELHGLVAGRWERLSAMKGILAAGPEGDPHDFLSFDLPDSLQGDVTLLVRVECEVYTVVTPRLLESSALARSFSGEHLLGGLLSGVMASAALVTIVLFWCFRQRAYLWLAAYQLTLLLYLAYIHGRLPPLRDPQLRVLAGAAVVEHVLRMCALAAGIQTLRGLLELRRAAPRWDRVLRWLLVVPVVLIVATPWLAPPLPDHVASAIAAAMPLVVLASCALALRARVPGTLWQLAGWSALSAGAVVSVGTQLHLLPVTLIGFHAFEVGATVQAILLVAALAHIVRRLQVAAQEHQAETDRANGELEEARMRMRALGARLSITQEKERREVARNLHDHVAQKLAAVRLRLGLLQDAVDAPERSELQAAARAVAEVLDDVRHLTFELSPPGLMTQGLEATLEGLGTRVLTPHGIGFESSHLAGSAAVPEDLRIVLYQVSRELLVNVVKHSGARHVELTTMEGDGHFSLMIEDDGRGFTPGRAPNGREGGFGLLSVVERVEQVGGKVELEARPGEGTRVTVHVPVRIVTPDAGGDA